MYSKSPNMETYREHRFVLRLIVRSAQFTLDYANTTSSLHNSLKTNATNQVTGMLQGSPGFISAEFKRFGPHTLKRKPRLLLEMIITHQINSMSKMVEKLKQEYIKPNLMFDPGYFETQHSFNSTCPAPVVKVDLNKTLDQANLIFTKDMRWTHLHALVNHSFCSQALQINTSWEVSKAILNSGVFGKFLYRPLHHKRKTIRLFQEMSIDSYLYISYVLRDRVDHRVLAYDYGYVLLVRPPPVANIIGDTSAIEGKGNVTLDALAADHSRARIPRLTFSWYCRRKEEHFPVDDSHLVDVPNGNSNTSGGCYGYGPGRLSGSDPYLNVNVNKMKAGQTYVFKVKIKLDSKYTTDDHNFMVISQANFTVSCTYNCRPKATINKRTVFETMCSGSLCQGITRYQWFLYKTNQTITEDPWIEIKNLQAKALTKLDGPNFVLAGKINKLEYSLEPDTIYKVKVEAFKDELQLKEDEITFRTNSPPFSYNNGRCTASPSDGLALQTSFLVNCSQWNDIDLPLSFTYSYYFSSTKDKVVIKSGSTFPSLKTILPQGHLSQDYNITILVEIADSLGAISYDTLVVKVRPLANVSLEMLKGIINGPNSTLDKSLREGNVGVVAVTANLMLSTLENTQMKEKTKNQVKDALLEKLGDVQVKDLEEVEQLSSFVTLATNKREDMPASSLDSTVELLGSMTDYLWTHVDNDSDHDKDAVQKVGQSIFQGFSNAMVITTSSKATNNGSGLKKPNDVTQHTLALIDKLGTTLLFTKVVGEEPSTYSTDTLSMTLDRQHPSVMGHTTLQGNEQLGGVVLPSAETMFGNKTTSLNYVDAQMLSLKENPYTWDESSQNISSPVIKFELKTGKGSVMNISDVKQPFEFLLPITKQAESGKNDSKDHLFVKPGNVLKYHEVNIDSEDKNVFVKLQPQNDTVFDVFVSSGIRPTERNYNFSRKIPDFSSCTIFKDQVGYFNCTRNPFVFSFSSAITGQTGPQFIGIRLANVTSSAKKENLKALARKARSCSGTTGRQKRSCITVKDPPTTPAPTATVIPKYNESADVNYTMLVSLPSCVYWSKNRQAWSKEGCKLGPNTTTEQLHCLCYHLSAFGANIFVAPNPIDFDTVFIKFTKLGETMNFVVLSTVCLIFGIYFIGLAFARRADRKDRLKVVAKVLLDDSAESMGCRYDISIQTGMWKGFGTTAKVGMIIVGKDGSSGALSLNDLSISRRFFSRASVNNFTLSVAASLGNLTGIYVWHDNSGAHPSWFLQHIIITDVQTQEMWHFYANQWIALDKGAGVTQLYLKVAEGKELKAFKPRFISRASRSLGEGHLWISVFTRPPHNPFTRCQRLSCCLSFLFTAMVTNAMFYNFGKTPSDTFKIGPLTMSWTQIIIGIQSSVISIPINVIVVLIFRNIKQVRSPDVYVVDSDTTKASGRLPRFFLYVAWAICVLVSLTGAFFTILYSMEWGTAKSNQWFTSILVSLVQDVLVTQPIKAVAFATLLSFIIRKPPEIDPVIGPSFFRDKNGNKTKYPSVKDKELKKKQEQSIKRRKMLEATKEILTFLIFAFLLMVICYGNQDPAAYQITRNIRDNICSGFDGIADTSSLWTWLEDDLIPALYDVTWYNGWPFKYKEGYISNREDFMLGMPRLRQLRLKPAKRCPSDLLYPYFTDTFNRCLPTYSSSNEDRTAFNLPGWIPLKSYNKSYYDVCPKPWRYQSKESIQSVSHHGVVRNYDGGGYVASLGYNKKTALDAVKDLKGNNWIDESTAVVFIEFTLFNPATSLFTIARHAYERLPTGEALTKSNVRTLSLYPSANANFQKFYEVCQLVFLIVIVVCFIAEIVKFIRQKRYFCQLWNWIELLLLVVCIVAVATSFFKAKYTSLYVKKVQENPYETFSPDHIERWSRQEIMWLSAAIFILTLKLLRLIRFNHHICQMQGTMKRSARPLISFFFVFGIGIMAFTYFGCIAFGAGTSLFMSLYYSFETNMLLSIGKQINYVDIYLISSNMELIFFFFYFLFVICLLMNVFVAVMVDSYVEIREKQGEDFDDAKTGAFMFAKFSEKVQQFPGKLVLGVKQIFDFRCPDLTMNTKAFKRGRKRKNQPYSTKSIPTLLQDVDGNNGTALECQELIPLERNKDFSEISQEARIAEIHDVIDDYYIGETRKELMGALTELSKYHASIGRNGRAATVLDQEK